MTDEYALLGVKSRRKPNTATMFSDADNIERQLQADGHKIWGWVIYRSTYENVDDWKEFLSRLQARTADTIDFWGGSDMLDSLDYKIFDDRGLFDRASTATIREHFKNWTATAPLDEQGTGPGTSQRYLCCIQVDAEALHPVVYDAPPLSRADASTTGWVKLVWRDWEFDERSLGDGGEEVVDVETTGIGSIAGHRS
ncbi:hypothetical protein LTR86_005899 [Recurvomyces mirabilis]|nr:hypothetical protein LTR86_005899 [Recurvomyces mirabilis]